MFTIESSSRALADEPIELSQNLNLGYDEETLLQMIPKELLFDWESYINQKPELRKAYLERTYSIFSRQSNPSTKKFVTQLKVNDNAPAGLSCLPKGNFAMSNASYRDSEMWILNLFRIFRHP